MPGPGGRCWGTQRLPIRSGRHMMTMIHVLVHHNAAHRHGEKHTATSTTTIQQPWKQSSNSESNSSNRCSIYTTDPRRGLTLGWARQQTPCTVLPHIPWLGMRRRPGSPPPTACTHGPGSTRRWWPGMHRSSQGPCRMRARSSPSCRQRSEEGVACARGVGGVGHSRVRVETDRGPAK
jgi:hypothetical protein